MKTMALGMAVIIVLIFSVYLLCSRKPFWCLISSIAVTALVCWTGSSWRQMLIGSGKNAALFGFERYPAALVILIVLLSAALTLLIISGIRLFKGK